MPEAGTGERRRKGWDEEEDSSWGGGTGSHTSPSQGKSTWAPSSEVVRDQSHQPEWGFSGIQLRTGQSPGERTRFLGHIPKSNAQGGKLANCASE